MKRPAVVLLSGGLDSATVLAIALAQGFACHALSFDYGQRHRVELDAARRVAERLGVVSHRWITIDLRAFGHSALTDDIPVPKDRLHAANICPSPSALHRDDPGAAVGDGPSTRGDESNSRIPVTYVPARNTIFLAYALALAEVIESSDIFIGVNAVDFSGYPDCRPDYIRAFTHMANLATRAAIEGRPTTIHTPLIDLTKAQIIQRGLELGVDYSLTHSCYDPDGRGLACGHCDACVLRRRAFETLGRHDPALAAAARLDADDLHDNRHPPHTDGEQRHTS